MKKRTAATWIVIAAAAAGLAAWSVARRAGQAAPAAGTAGALPVVVALPRVGSIERTLAYSGTLAPEAVVTLTPKAAGKVEEVLVKDGDLVRQGQMLVRMEDDAVRLQARQAGSALEAARAQREKARRGVRPEELASAQASLAQAEEDFQAAEEAWERAGRLYREGTIAKAGWEEADGRYRAARTQLDNARRGVAMMQQGASAEDQDMAEATVGALQAQYDLATLQVDNTRVVSPVAGRVAKVLLDEGNLASPSTPLLIVVRDEEMVIRIPLPEKLYGEFHDRPGAIEARVSVTALPSPEPRVGRVGSISPTVDPASRTFTAEVRLANPDGRMRAGMYAAVDFVMERFDGALLLPRSALVTRRDRQGVFLFEPAPAATSAPGIARFRAVRTGIEDASRVQVIDGLETSSRVVIDGNAFLEDGQAVSPEG
jgi:HlyD family secretion protein